MTGNAQTARSADAVISRAVAQSLESAAHPLSQFGIEALVAGAARPRPGAMAFADHHDGASDKVSFADLYQRVGAFLARLRDFELNPRDRVIICAPPGVQSFVALVAALAAGLEPVLAPMPLPTTSHLLTLAARDIEAAALFAPAQFCGVDFEQNLLTLVAFTPSIRFIGALDGALDGASDFSAAALMATQASRARLLEEWSDAERPMIGAINDVGDVEFVSQSALLAATLDLIRLMRNDSHAPILSLCAPSSPAALVAGPLTALISGAPLHFLAPFEAARFLATLDALGPARLVAPAAIIADLACSGVLSSGAITNVATPVEGDAPLTTASMCRIVELRTKHGKLSLRVLNESGAV